MSLPRLQRATVFAPWSLRVFSLAAQLLAATLILHRFAALPTAVAINLMAVGFVACAAAALFGFAGLVQIWRHGGPGTVAASSALLLGALLLLIPGYYIPSMWAPTAAYDVSTDREQPPAYQALAKARQSAGIVDVAEPSSTGAAAQVALAPIQTNRSPGDVFDLTNDVLKQMDLTVAAEEAPGFGEADGTIEATERTLLLGLTDDVSIRIGTRDGATRVDVRSAARYPRLDLGRNGLRAQQILQKIQATIDASVPSAEVADVATGDVKTPGGTADAATATRRKKRGPVPAGAQGGQGLPTSRH